MNRMIMKVPYVPNKMVVIEVVWQDMGGGLKTTMCNLRITKNKVNCFFVDCVNKF